MWNNAWGLRKEMPPFFDSHSIMWPHDIGSISPAFSTYSPSPPLVWCWWLDLFFLGKPDWSVKTPSLTANTSFYHFSLAVLQLRCWINAEARENRAKPFLSVLNMIQTQAAHLHEHSAWLRQLSRCINETKTHQSSTSAVYGSQLSFIHKTGPWPSAKHNYTDSTQTVTQYTQVHSGEETGECIKLLLMFIQMDIKCNSFVLHP